MATTARSIASLTLSFGLVNVPVRLYSATESGSELQFKLLDKDGGRLKQQYVNERSRKVVERKDMVKGYEVEPDHFVLFSPAELKELEDASSHVIEIVAFVPLASIDPLFYDKSYLLAPDKRGAKPYALLREAMRKAGRCALAKWAWKARQNIVQIRASADGLVLHQLRYADEVRSLRELDIEREEVKPAELQLALQLVDQIASDEFNPADFEDEEKQRVLAAVEQKVKGKRIVASSPREDGPASAQVIDLMEALRSSLGRPARAGAGAAGKAAKSHNVTPIQRAAPARKAAKRAPARPAAADAPAARSRARK
ncbi:MAG: Ku protein [Burkholderiaceae bacterium]